MQLSLVSVVMEMLITTAWLCQWKRTICIQGHSNSVGLWGHNEHSMVTNGRYCDPYCEQHYKSLKRECGISNCNVQKKNSTSTLPLLLLLPCITHSQGTVSVTYYSLQILTSIPTYKFLTISKYFICLAVSLSVGYPGPNDKG